MIFAKTGNMEGDCLYEPRLKTYYTIKPDFIGKSKQEKDCLKTAILTTLPQTGDRSMPQISLFSSDTVWNSEIPLKVVWCKACIRLLCISLTLKTSVKQPCERMPKQKADPYSVIKPSMNMQQWALTHQTYQTQQPVITTSCSLTIYTEAFTYPS